MLQTHLPFFICAINLFFNILYLTGFFMIIHSEREYYKKGKKDFLFIALAPRIKASTKHDVWDGHIQTVCYSVQQLGGDECFCIFVLFIRHAPGL